VGAVTNDSGSSDGVTNSSSEPTVFLSKCLNGSSICDSQGRVWGLTGTTTGIEAVPGPVFLFAGGIAGAALGEAVGVTEETASVFEQLSAAAGRAAEGVGPGRGPVYGTNVHSAFQAEVEALGQS